MTCGSPPSAGVSASSSSASSSSGRPNPNTAAADSPVPSRSPFAYRECGMPKAERPEKNRDGVLNPAVQRRHAKRSRRQMGGSGVDEDANQYVCDDKTSHSAKQGLQKFHVNLPLLRLKLSLYPSVTAQTTSCDGSISPGSQDVTWLLQQGNSYPATRHVDTPCEHPEIRRPRGPCSRASGHAQQGIRRETASTHMSSSWGSAPMDAINPSQRLPSGAPGCHACNRCATRAMPSSRSSPRRSISPSVYMSMMSPTSKLVWPWVYCDEPGSPGRHRAGPSAGGGISTVPVLARRIRIGGWPAVA